MAEFDATKHCGAQRTNQPPGTLCTRPKGWGTDHPGVGRCYRHLGSTRNHRRSAAIEIARRECVTLGIPVEIHPAEALVEEVFRCRGNVEFYERLVQDLPTHPEPDTYIPSEGEGDKGHWERGETGVYGRTYHMSGIPTGEGKPHVLVTMYNEERDRLVRASAAALKAGIDEAQLHMAEREAALIAEGFRAFAEALGHDPASPEVREAFRAQLVVLAGSRTT